MNRPSLDFQIHLARLEASGLLVRVDRPINKDTELHPLVRWQFQGGIPEDERRAFLFRVSSIRRAGSKIFRLWSARWPLRRRFTRSAWAARSRISERRG